MDGLVRLGFKSMLLGVGVVIAIGMWFAGFSELPVVEFLVNIWNQGGGYMIGAILAGSGIKKYADRKNGD